MKKCFVACLVVLPLLLQAQAISVTYSKKFSLKDPGLTSKDGATFLSGDFFYSREVDYKGMQLAYTAKLDKVKYGVNIYKYDLDMKELKKVSVKGKEKQFGPFVPKMIMFNHMLVLFYYKALEDHSIQLSLSTFDPETLEERVTKDLYLIAEKNVGFLKLGEAMGNNRLLLARSPDNSRLLVVQSGNTDEVFSCIVNANIEIERPSVTKIRNSFQKLTIQHCTIDNEKNKYLSYSHNVGNGTKQGLLVQNNAGKESFLPLNMAKGAMEANELYLKMSRDNSRMYVYGSYRQDAYYAGVLLTIVDAGQLTVASPQLFPYPQDLKDRLKKMDYGQKEGDGPSMDDTYMSNELEDGTLVITGYPVHVLSGTNSGMNGQMISYYHPYAGPIINAFLKDGKGSFGVLYRDQTGSQASDFIALPYGNHLLCVYNASEKSITSDDPAHIGGVSPEGNLVLAQADLSGDGIVVSRKKIENKPGSLSFFTEYTQRISKNKYLIPMGRNRVNMVRYYTEVEQWATLTIE